jgi:hypothetical protein
MVDRMLATGLWQTGGKTPSATLYAAISREIKAKGATGNAELADWHLQAAKQLGKDLAQHPEGHGGTVSAGPQDDASRATQ